MAEEVKPMVNVLVGKSEDGEFSGFWATFEGVEVVSCEVLPRLVYTLYLCTEFKAYDGYRVHKRDESNPEDPVYELYPSLTDSSSAGGRPQYVRPYDAKQLVEKHPLFVRRVEDLKRQIPTFRVRPGEVPW